MSIELDRRRAHLASGGTISNYNREHYRKENEMIKATLTTTLGTTREMSFNTKEHILEFIELFGATLPMGTAVNIDAPLVGIHGGWIHGKAPKM